MAGTFQTCAGLWDACDHRDCTAPGRVRAVFVVGELNLCGHHWRCLEPAVVASATFLHAADEAAVVHGAAAGR
ncbi:MAG: hypothetical protein H0V19_07390 [Euzebyales bacterium]|nr:hypothetical protein [Euzebyales bacterium]